MTGSIHTIYLVAVRNWMPKAPISGLDASLTRSYIHDVNQGIYFLSR